MRGGLLMPTHDEDPRFVRDVDRLASGEYKRFRAAVLRFVEALDRGDAVPSGFGIRVLAGYPGIYEFHWAPNGRATFEFGSERLPGKRHVYWRRVGGHDIYDNP
jgi:NAD(P)-dependent dehydrogenase (short-subunit alcohol dehydrogenase family)